MSRASVHNTVCHYGKCYFSLRLHLNYMGNILHMLSTKCKPDQFDIDLKNFHQGMSMAKPPSSIVIPQEIQYHSGHVLIFWQKQDVNPMYSAFNDDLKEPSMGLNMLNQNFLPSFYSLIQSMSLPHYVCDSSIQLIFLTLTFGCLFENFLQYCSFIFNLYTFNILFTQFLFPFYSFTLSS